MPAAVSGTQRGIAPTAGTLNRLEALGHVLDLGPDHTQLAERRGAVVVQRQASHTHVQSAARLLCVDSDCILRVRSQRPLKVAHHLVSVRNRLHTSPHQLHVCNRLRSLPVIALNALQGLQLCGGLLARARRRIPDPVPRAALVARHPGTLEATEVRIKGEGGRLRLLVVGLCPVAAELPAWRARGLQLLFIVTLLASCIVKQTEGDPAARCVLSFDGVAGQIGAHHPQMQFFAALQYPNPFAGVPPRRLVPRASNVERNQFIAVTRRMIRGAEHVHVVHRAAVTPRTPQVASVSQR
mmetsp:Transcript_19785/g.50274  ORF Transcript_19785/g.50274 Transcript_19785/m.50274 type:complete len:297 (-) Transcript_19785:144-1034(-)